MSSAFASALPYLARNNFSNRFGKITMLPVLITGVLVLTISATTYADPPQALPINAEINELKFQPAFDYDKDGCYPTPAIGRDGTLAPGLSLGGAPNGKCRDMSDLDNTNSYSRYKCNNGWCAFMYDLYFEKDQALGVIGHRHDWEHVVVWVQQGNPNPVQFVATSAHGRYTVHPRANVRFDSAGRPKIVYHKEGGSTHSFRLANANDEPPENHKGTWQYPALVGWNIGYPAGLRNKLTSANFGTASMAIKDGSFVFNLQISKPAGIPFNENA